MAKERKKLTAAEEKRLRKFERTKEALAEQGFKARNLTISVLAGNLMALVIMLPLCAVASLAYHLANPDFQPGNHVFYFFLTVAASTVIHELIHGITWSCFSQNGWKDIEFGFIWAALTPYCTCGAPLSRKQYLLGSAMPTIVLGILLTAAAVITGEYWIFLSSLVMIIGGGGDFTIILKVLMDHPQKEVLYHDHPTELGVVVFEK